MASSATYNHSSSSSSLNANKNKCDISIVIKQQKGPNQLSHDNDLISNGLDEKKEENGNLKKQIILTSHDGQSVYLQIIGKTQETNNTQYPKWWNVSLFSCNLQYATPHRIHLPLSHPKSDQIEKTFYQQLPSNYQIIRIEAIQNQMLFDSYWSERKKLIKLIGENNVNERELFHGTQQHVIQKIEVQGFRKEFNYRAKYGEGTYFAKHAGYALNYAEKNEDGVYKMLVCQVICGEMYVGDQDYKLTKWPTKQYGLLYDSLVDDVYNPSIFVIHGDSRAYPMFVIHFVDM